jgi:O-antigen/teichoic acid export membrane protein
MELSRLRLLSPAALITRYPRVFREGAWVTAGQGVTALVALASTRLLTEYIPPPVYGAASLLLGVMTLGRNIFCLPLLQAAARLYPELRERGETALLRRTIAPFLAKATLILCAVILLGGALWSRVQPVSFLAFVALSCLLGLEVARTFETNLLSAARRQRPVAALEVIEAVVRPLAVVAFVVLLGATTQVILFAYAAAVGMGFLGALLLVHREGVTDAAAPPADPSSALAAEIWKYALPLMPLAFVLWVSSISDRYIIGGLSGLKAAGLYAAVYGLMSQPFLMVQGIIGRTLTPPYFAAVSRGDEPLERRIFNAWLGATAAVCSAGVILVILLRPLISQLLLAEEYRAASNLIPWIALGNAILAIDFVFSKKLYAQKRTKTILLGYSVGAAASLVITLPFVWYAGLYGAAIACPIYFFVQLVVTVFLTGRRA